MVLNAHELEEILEVDNVLEHALHQLCPQVRLHQHHLLQWSPTTNKDSRVMQKHKSLGVGCGVWGVGCRVLGVGCREAVVVVLVAVYLWPA